MTAGWIAPAVRGDALLRRSVGAEGASAIARADDWPTARAMLATTVYGRGLPAGADRSTAEIIAERAAVWQIRVLAGWLPPGGAALARLAVAPFEIAIVDRRLGRWSGGEDRDAPAEATIDLGTLGTAWPAVARAASPSEVRSVLRRSSWGDPGGDDRASVALGLRVAWARRSIHLDPMVRPWALGAVAVLAARERFAFERSVAATTAVSIDRLLGAGWRHTDDLEAFRRRLPEPARWALTGVDDPAQLWRAELAVLARVGRDAGPVAAVRRPSRTTVIAILALVVVDTWRVTAAIEAAGRGAAGREVFDAVAA